jgi:hypothetical protein
MGLTLPNFAYPISNVIVPQSGPKTVPAVADFSNAGSIDIDGQSIIDAHGIEYIQGVFIDNASNAVAFTLVCAGTNQRIVAAPNSQGFYPLLVQSPPRFTATMAQAANRTVNLQFYNVPIMTSVWKSV